MQNCVSVTDKMFHGFLVLYFKCATAEIKHWYVSVLLYYSCFLLILRAHWRRSLTLNR